MESNMDQRFQLHIWKSLPWKVSALLLIVLLSTTFAGLAEPRVVVMGDMHGDLPRLIELLQMSKLTDSQSKWVGGKSILVLTGDLMDRGPQVRDVMDLLMRLEKDANKKGGKVVTLFGNHEMMNIIGDLRYVTPEIYAYFADNKSEKRRKDAYKKYLRIRRRQARENDQPEPDDSPEAEAKWMAARPLGFVEYRKAMSRRGEYGRWLRKLPAVAQIGGTIFLHGGIHPDLGSLGIDAINERIKQEVASFDFITDFLVREELIEPFFEFDEIRISVGHRLNQLNGGIVEGGDSVAQSPDPRLSEQERAEVNMLESFLNMGGWLSVHPDGPLWFRGYGKWTETEGTQHISQLLQRYGADQFVVGHTITADRDIMKRFGGKVFLVDTVQPSALEIQGSQFTAIYREGREAPTPSVAEAEVSAVSH
jgi:hypothetical protein